MTNFRSNRPTTLGDRCGVAVRQDLYNPYIDLGSQFCLTPPAQGDMERAARKQMKQGNFTFTAPWILLCADTNLPGETKT